MIVSRPNRTIRACAARPAARLLGAGLLAGLLVLPAMPRAAAAAELVMLEQDYCDWCERWHEDVGVIYAKTAEGRRAPLRRVDIHSPLPEDLAHLKTGRFTPTFVLIDDGREVGRIRGYPGEDFFWGLLGQLLEKLSAPAPRG